MVPLRVFVGDVEQPKHRFQQRAENRLHQNAQRHAGQRDAELRRADVGVNVRDDVPRLSGAAVALRGERRQLRIADADERQLRRDEKGVAQHQQPPRASNLNPSSMTASQFTISPRRT